MSKLLTNSRVLPKAKSLQYFLERTTPFGTLARRQRNRQLQKKFRRWQKSGASAPMPHLGKQRVVLEYIRMFSTRVFVETGTYKGKMVYAVMPHVEETYSIELDETLCRKAQRRFAGYHGVHILQGQSGEVLPGILDNIDEPCLFWLDAHWSGGSTTRGQIDTPIMQELEYILNHARAKQHVTLIDDARYFTGENDYPELDKLKHFILGILPGAVFEVRDDIIRVSPG